MALSARFTRSNVGVNILLYLRLEVLVSKKLACLALAWMSSDLRSIHGANKIRADELHFRNVKAAFIREQSFFREDVGS